MLSALEPPAPAPASAVRDGQPRTGTYAGVVGHTRWDELAALQGRGAVWRRARRKRWHWVGAYTDELAVIAAAVDVGWSALGFACVFDRRAGTLLFDGAWPAWPGAASIAETPAPGARSRFARGRHVVEVHVDADTLALEVRAPGLSIDAWLAAAPDGRPGLAAIASPIGGTASCTHKRTGLPTAGRVELGGRTHMLDGGFGNHDHSVAILGRETRWRWAAATGPALGLNLVEGFIGAPENVVWVDGEMHAVGTATIAFDPRDPLAPWRVTTANGVVELTFRPQGLRRQDQDLKLARSAYVMPFGVFDGTLRLPGRAPVKVRELVGVTEDHLSVW